VLPLVIDDVLVVVGPLPEEVSDPAVPEPVVVPTIGLESSKQALASQTAPNKSPFRESATVQARLCELNATAHRA
jgi:hypothetical protein